MSFELILVDDCSPDEAWSVIQRLARDDQRVKGISLSRNFGQHYAIAAGLDHAQGQWVVVMDCDLQDHPEMIPRLLERARSTQADIVCGTAAFRAQPGWLHRQFSRLYYRVYDHLSGETARSYNFSFVLMRRPVVDAYCQLRESRRQHLSLLQHLGYRVSQCEVDHSERRYGTSAYSLWSRIRLALFGIASGTTRLLRVGVYMGVAFSTGSVLAAAAIVLAKMFFVDFAAGWASVITAVFFVGGMNLLVLGIIGIYLETIFYEVKRRPIYFVREQINLRTAAGTEREHGSCARRLMSDTSALDGLG